MMNHYRYETLEEGDTCPECHEGEMIVPKVENCSCHLGHPPCSACEDNRLTCSECGFEDDGSLYLV